ncbi:F-box protein [Vitis vinifera]|uniref:F-box protein n=1 Tax=Vitis vinifera TaxID=29760 RepID=A0A438KQ39_VITVI|nr:F-box protein [Vitis vinifera]
MGQSHSSSSAGAAPAPPAIPMGPVVPTSLLAPAMSSAPGMYLRESNSSLRSTARSPLYISMPETDDCVESSEVDGPDYTSDLPDDILACIFQFLSTGDRKRCSLVCQRWLLVEGRSRHRLSLNAQSEIIPLIPCIFFRFDSVSKLTLKCDRRSISISDDALILISNLSKNLTRLKLRGCRELTDVGMAALAKNCKGLKKLSCGSCTFGTKGINAVLDHCSALEELSVKRLRGMNDRGVAEPIGPGVAASSLKSLCLKELYNGQCFERLVVASKKLRTLKLFGCFGDWDRFLETDPECTNLGLVSVAGNCKLLRKLHIDGWRTNRIGDEGLIAVAKQCTNLQELVLIGVNPTSSRCPISDHGMEALAWGCPNLVKVKVKKCPGVTCEAVDSLRARREALIVNLDAVAVETLDASTSDGGAQEDGQEPPPMVSQVTVVDGPSGSNGLSALFKSKFGHLQAGT